MVRRRSGHRNPLLRKGIEDQADCMPWLGIEPWMDPCRSDPRYASVLKEIGADSNRPDCALKFQPPFCAYPRETSGGTGEFWDPSHDDQTNRT